MKLFYFLVACVFTPQFGMAADAPQLREGIWGGDRLRVTVTEKGVDFKWDCAHGSIDHPVTLVDGLMNEQGTVVGEGGPESPKYPRPIFQADFTGAPDGKDFPIQITIYGSSSVTSHVYRLQYGRDVQLNQCL